MSAPFKQPLALAGAAVRTSATIAHVVKAFMVDLLLRAGNRKERPKVPRRAFVLKSVSAVHRPVGFAQLRLGFGGRLRDRRRCQDRAYCGDRWRTFLLAPGPCGRLHAAAGDWYHRN